MLTSLAKDYLRSFRGKGIILIRTSKTWEIHIANLMIKSRIKLPLFTRRIVILRKQRGWGYSARLEVNLDYTNRLQNMLPRLGTRQPVNSDRRTTRLLKLSKPRVISAKMCIMIPRNKLASKSILNWPIIVKRDTLITRTPFSIAKKRTCNRKLVVEVTNMVISEVSRVLML